MGRASNRKKAQRQASQGPQPDAAAQQAMHRLAARLQALAEETDERQDRAAAARWIWSGGAEPTRAEAPQWPENSLGGRFFGATFLREARKAPSLLTAEIPDPTVIAAHSAHWNVATFALVRAVAYDGLAPDHLAVSRLLDVLAPIAEAELAHGARPDREAGKLELPDQDGPEFLLGTCVLTSAARAAVGEDPLTGIQAVLLPALHDALPDLDPQAAADALIGAVARNYPCNQPGDAELLDRIGPVQGDALIHLARSGAVSPRDILPVGLTLLSALARLCRSDSASLLDRAT